MAAGKGGEGTQSDSPNAPPEKRSQLELARARVYLSEAEAAAEQLGDDLAGVMKARARLARADYGLSETTVYAPHDGWITNLQLAPGKNLLLARWEVMSLLTADPWWINANFTERSLERIRPGDCCELALKSNPGRIFSCRVKSVNRGVAQGQGTALRRPAERHAEPESRPGLPGLAGGDRPAPQPRGPARGGARPAQPSTLAKESTSG